MKMIAFAKRCAKEILRDPLNIMFGLGFPVILLFMLNAIQSNIPVDLFRIEKLAPGMAVFGLSFMTLFSATLVAKDRESSFLQRLYTMPMKPLDFILGYMLPLVLIAAAQITVCYAAAVIIGMPVTINIFFAVLAAIPAMLFNIALGLLCGSVFNVKQVGGICGALLTNLSAWLSGVWFDLDLLGGVLGRIANFLPFVHIVELERAAIDGNFEEMQFDFFVVIIYTAAVVIGAVFAFLSKMKKQ
ncbi:MAG: ABC transporter permease [Ruminococcaceae bacterium]|nr:ABC transporter permease [Oscillospiraceae bacterium]